MMLRRVAAKDGHPRYGSRLCAAGAGPPGETGRAREAMITLCVSTVPCAVVTR